METLLWEHEKRLFGIRGIVWGSGSSPTILAPPPQLSRFAANRGTRFAFASLEPITDPPKNDHLPRTSSAVNSRTASFCLPSSSATSGERAVDNQSVAVMARAFSKAGVLEDGFVLAVEKWLSELLLSDAAFRQLNTRAPEPPHWHSIGRRDAARGLTPTSSSSTSLSPNDAAIHRSAYEAAKSTPSLSSPLKLRDIHDLVVAFFFPSSRLGDCQP